MKLWLDAQLSPHLAQWLESSFGLETLSARRLGLRDATDQEIFEAAR
jgi:predicted nuclease of predicted toxin-antitoxin system